MSWITSSDRGDAALLLNDPMSVSGEAALRKLRFVTGPARFVFQQYRWLLLTLPIYALIVYGVAAWPLASVLAIAAILYTGLMGAASKRFHEWFSEHALYLRCVEIGLISIGASLLYMQNGSFSSYRFYYDGFYAIFVALAAISAGRTGVIWSGIAATIAVGVGQLMLAPAVPALFSISSIGYWLSVLLYTGTFGVFFMAVGLLARLSTDFRTTVGETTLLESVGQQFQSLRDAVLVLKEDGTVVNANPAAAEIFDMHVKLLKGKQVKELIRFSSNRRDDVIRTTTPTCLRRPLLLTGLRVNGEEFPVELTMSRYRPLEGGPAAAVAVIRDLSERQLMVQVAAQRERLATVGELVARVIHELASPLTGISTLVNDMVASSNETERPTLEMVLGEARRANEIIRELLAFVRRDSGKSTVCVNDAVERALKLSELRNDGATVQVVTDFSLDEPHAVGSLGRLQQVVLNLIENARHAVSDRDDGRIIVRTGEDGDEVYLEVADNGEGIPAEIQERIFEPFYTTKQPEVGTGLGLAIVESIVSDFGGKISLRSNGEGTTFRVSLRAASDEDAS